MLAFPALSSAVHVLRLLDPPAGSHALFLADPPLSPLGRGVLCDHLGSRQSGRFTAAVATTIPLGILGMSPEIGLLDLRPCRRRTSGDPFPDRFRTSAGWVAVWSSHRCITGSITVWIASRPVAHFSLLPIWDHLFGTWQGGGSQQDRHRRRLPVSPRPLGAARPLAGLLRTNRRLLSPQPGLALRRRPERCAGSDGRWRARYPRSASALHASGR